VHLNRISDADRESDEELWKEYTAAHPRILAALLDDISGVLRELPEVRKRRGWPRMADYAQILAALDMHLQKQGRRGGHLAAYVEAVEAASRESAEDDPFTGAVIAFMANRTVWQGRATDLLEAMEPRPEHRPQWWPRSGQAVGAQLDKNVEPLRYAGIGVARLPRTMHSRPWRLWEIEP
jgi:hypothetical protein